jgi:hypothetical protein
MTTTAVRECPDIESSTDEYAARFDGPGGEHLLDVQNRAVMRLARPWLGRSILDVGGGHAQLCRPLLDARCSVTARLRGELPRATTSNTRIRSAPLVICLNRHFPIARSTVIAN